MLRMLWDWAVGNRCFNEAINVAAAGHFDAFSLTWRRLKAEEMKGRTIEDLISYATDHGIRLEFLDGLTCWAPIRVPETASAEVRAAFDFTPEEAFDLCAKAGLTRIVAMGGFEPGALERAQMIESFGKFCAEAATYGLHVALEPIASIGGLKSLDDVWPIVEGAAQANSGVLLDTWHFMRGGADFDLLASIPTGLISDVQIVDGTLAPLDNDPWLDGLNSRLEPGAGSLPLTRILQEVKIHQPISVGPEWYNATMNGLTATALGRQLAKSTHLLLEEVGMATDNWQLPAIID